MEHSSSANDLMEAQRTDNQQHDLDKTMASFHQLMPLVVAITCLLVTIVISWVVRVNRVKGNLSGERHGCSFFIYRCSRRGGKIKQLLFLISQ